MFDETERKLLGLPSPATMAADFLDEISRHEGGLSPRGMHKIRPDVPAHEWMRVGVMLLRKGKVNHQWRPLPQPNYAAQESVYTIWTMP